MVFIDHQTGDSKALAKVCYYGTKASGENGFFSENILIFPLENSLSLSIWLRLMPITVVIAFSGTNATGQALAMELYNYCMSQPEIPEVDMSFSQMQNVTAYISGNSQRTEEITFKASELQTITMKLPSGVKLHNVTTGKNKQCRCIRGDLRRYQILLICTADTGSECQRGMVCHHEGKHHQRLFRL